ISFSSIRNSGVGHGHRPSPRTARHSSAPAADLPPARLRGLIYRCHARARARGVTPRRQATAEQEAGRLHASFEENVRRPPPSPSHSPRAAFSDLDLIVVYPAPAAG
ncbi:Os08g0202500, partial [Oryza sativa Japonica Group]